MTYAGKHDALRFFNERKVAVGHFRLRAQVAQRLEYRGQVARFVVDYRDAHSLVSQFVHRFYLTFPQGLGI